MIQVVNIDLKYKYDEEKALYVFVRQDITIYVSVEIYLDPGYQVYIGKEYGDTRIREGKKTERSIIF
jgi:hypothetical protein